ncbi:hypothetical protein [Sphaerothrix gracilis]|uniref:hypothetical protein n=1 Tax=Sphaerothrix gracilis TaxID=3151835 RepID=UPI0031FBAF5E
MYQRKTLSGDRSFDLETIMRAIAGGEGLLLFLRSLENSNFLEAWHRPFRSLIGKKTPLCFYEYR